MIAQLCVHQPHWPTTTFLNRDYIIAHKLFVFDLSTSERDKKDFKLVQRIYSAYEPGAIVMGWHCVRDNEHEAIALSARFGHYGLCSLHTPNLTVHSSIRLKPNETFNQPRKNNKGLKIEDKVYIAYMATDGDASWFMLNHVQNDWKDPEHGKFKYNWGFLPLAYDLMPGTVKYYLENLSEMDYFVAGPSGATYTYPHLHPKPESFLKLTEYYMQKCGLKTVHLTNWYDREWWQEVHLTNFVDLVNKYIPSAVGYVRGMGESAFEKHYIGNGKPFIFCGEGIHRDSNIYQTMRDFIDACPNRPLFIFNLVNHSIPMGQVKKAMDRFKINDVEMVHLDELIYLIDRAYKLGKISDELYPNKEGIKKILAREAKMAWPSFYDELLQLEQKVASGEKIFLEEIKKIPQGLETINPGDFLAFKTIWQGMKLIKLTLESIEIYVNHKPTATLNFVQRFASLDNVKIVEQLEDLWNHWFERTISFRDAADLLKQLVKIARQLNTI
jgi:hypothetical protein